ncbi:hypothetical protein L484_018051 [Morus notabilis]|uniref:Uncharacterized protein n=1 Tax=Morus notabilis TaxID=981085 RepID=W9QV56_9ROSA|nr:hypothetical protein L484_018051 [Morus notabilis]
MALFSSLFGCFSDSSRRVSESGEELEQRKPSGELAQLCSQTAKSKDKNKEVPPPILLSNFPVGMKFSLL